jgi:hypothetical protein
VRGYLIKILAIVLLVGAVALLAAVVVLDREHQVILRGPYFSYADHAGAETRALLRIEPLRAPGLMTAITSTSGTSLPPWAVSRVMPYEVTLLFAPAPASESIGVVTFLNAQRLGPDIARVINEYFASGALPAVQWTPEGMTAPQRGLLLANGSMRMNPIIRKAWEATWSQRDVRAPLSLNQSHVIELVLDNRDGGAFLVLGTLLMGDLHERPEGALDPNVVAETVSDIVSCRLTADEAEAKADVLAIRVEFACIDSITEQTKGMFRFLYEMGLGELQRQATLHGMSLEGTSAWQGTHLVGEYTLNNVSRLFVTTRR